MTYDYEKKSVIVSARKNTFFVFLYGNLRTKLKIASQIKCYKEIR